MLAAYREPDGRRSTIELVITAVPFLAIAIAAMFSIKLGLWWALVLIIPATAFLVRLFMIQHDCGHGNLFRRRAINNWIGRVIGVLTLTPYDYWRRTHAVHHASAGNLDQRGLGDMKTVTVREFREMSGWRRFGYRVYRNPVFLFGLGSAVTFLLKHRLPFGLMKAGPRPWLSTMGTNAAIAVVAGGLIWGFGLGPVLLVVLPVTLLAGAVGIWLFYVQHQFEETFWASTEEWSFEEGALHGSSHYDLPPVLRWFTANIGIHHVHHLASRIPFYRLNRVLRDHPNLQGVNRLTLWQSFRTIRLALWDEDKRRLVPFRAVQQAG